MQNGFKCTVLLTISAHSDVGIGVRWFCYVGDPFEWLKYADKMIEQTNLCMLLRGDHTREVVAKAGLTVCISDMHTWYKHGASE